MQFREEHRKVGTWYRTYEDGTVVAFGPEDGPEFPDRWIASGWSAHPLDDDSAVHLGHLCVDAPRSELETALTNWESLDTRSTL
jgi:hypothetical protein